ncbi:MAG: THUMP domain-containing protein, partial [Candidatus ainarchaeum sp.]|nr:THUMP domain-containing protein [Candidatus ainarchaeum sp.]
MFSSNCVIVVIAPEISLKSDKVRATFIDLLRENIALSLKRNSVQYEKILFSKQRFFILTNEIDKTVEILKNCFGVFSLIKSKRKIISSKEKVIEIGKEIFSTEFNSSDSFAIRCKSFNDNIKSRDVEIELGGKIVESFKLKVNLTKPDKQLNILINENFAYYYFNEIVSCKGMPIGAQGYSAIISDNE